MPIGIIDTANKNLVITPAIKYPSLKFSSFRNLIMSAKNELKNILLKKRPVSKIEIAFSSNIATVQR